MTNIQYIEKMIRTNDRLYIDTATLMETAKIRTFIKSAEPYLKELNKKFYIHHSVKAELARHMYSNIPEKEAASMNAIALIAENPDVFEIDNEIISEEDQNAFADADVLSELINRRSKESQLLITNDRDLSKDAFSFNQLESCQGFQIKVCYLDNFGGLQMCACVREYKQQNSDSIVVKETYVEKETPSIESAHVHISNDKHDTSNNSSTVFVLSLELSSVFAFGFLVGKYGKAITNSAIGLMKSII